MRTGRSGIRRRLSGWWAMAMSVGLALMNDVSLLAQEATMSPTEKAAASSPATWAIPYIIVIVVLAPGVCCVVMSSKRLERPKKEK
ncbi:MAG: hypothetical protein Q4C47_09120 [Planctomycetia bacterium]|nr:hypothetical protein [Planctomycetia bacterium]